MTILPPAWRAGVSADHERLVPAAVYIIIGVIALLLILAVLVVSFPAVIFAARQPLFLSWLFLMLRS